jgi:hypothetical protein
MKFILFFGLLLSYPLGTADPPSSQVVYTPYEDARSVLETLVDALPAKLRDVPVEEREAIWNEWTKKRDAQIRDRLAQGDADSVMNFLMFGTSFTAEARLTSAQLQSLSEATSGVAKLDATSKWREIFEKRVEALVRGMMAPGTNERLQFAAKTLERAGIQFSDAASKDKARRYLYENVQRVLQEQAGFRQTLAAAKSLNDPTEEFAERSKLYKDRGLSLDTSLPPDYALEVALKEMSARGLLKPGSVARVGIIGPGLDFADKQEGYDFYPPQTAQPFAVMLAVAAGTRESEGTESRHARFESAGFGVRGEGKGRGRKRARLHDSIAEGSSARLEYGPGGLLETIWESDWHSGGAGRRAGRA